MKTVYSLVFFIILMNPVFGAFDYPARGAKNAGLGNSDIASTTALDGFLMNPALSINSSVFYGALNYFQIFNLKDLRYANGIVSFPFKSVGIGLGVEDFGNELYSENQITLNISRLFYNEHLSVGLSLQYYHISVQNYGSSDALGVTVGVRYRALSNTQIAAVVENFNQPSLNGHSEEIPQRVQIGLQFKPVESLITYIKVQKDSWYKPATCLGLEYQLFHNLGIYSGYSTLATIPSFGIELNMFKIDINYGLQYHFDLGPTHFIGIAFSQ